MIPRVVSKMGASRSSRLAPVAGFLLAAIAALGFLGLRTGAAPAPLTTLQYRVTGTELRVSPAFLSVPKGIAGSLRVQLLRGDGTSEPADSGLADNAYVEAILRGPSFPARRLVARPGDPLLLPSLNLVGDYQVDGVRLVDATSGETRLEGSPARVRVQVFDEVLVSRVTSRPLSMQEITEKGIVVDSDNFRAVEFEVGFVLEGRVIPVRFPVVAPDFRQSTELIPAAEVEKRLVEAQRINSELARLVEDSGQLPAELQRPGLNIQIKGVNFEKAEANAENLRLPIPPIPALLVIPGHIGYLNQFFSVQVFTENGAPANSGLSVFNVQAKLRLPPGPDGLVSTNYSEPGDDPLRFARVGPNAEIRDLLPIVGPAPTSLTRFQPGQGGAAEFLVEGLQEGLHVMDLDLTADLDGLAAGSVKVRGKAAGSVLVRNPKFSLSFSHPRAVRSGEPYLARVTVLNTSSIDANQVNITLRAASLSGGVLETPEVVQLGDLRPGQSATAVYRVRAQRTGSVRFSNLTTGSASVEGRFNLTMAIDERGVELAPDAIGMPDYVDELPEGVLTAANRVLGQALGAATAPLLPPGVLPVSRAIVTRRVLELAEAGQRWKYGDVPTRVLLDLLLDWQGGRGTDDGFDQILRTTDAGREFREALAAALESADAADAAARLTAALGDVAGRSEPWWFAASSVPGVVAGMPGSAGPLNSTLPGAAGYAGTRGSFVALRGAAARPFQFQVTEPTTRVDLVMAGIQTNGTGTRWQWTLTGLPAGGCLAFDAAAGGELVRDDDCDGLAEAVLPPAPATVTEQPPAVVAVHQDTGLSLARPFHRCTAGPANNYGNVLGVLFSKPMRQTDANRPSAFQLEGGIAGAGVQVQPGGRVALVSLREAISAIRPRKLTVTGIADLRGNPVVEEPKSVVTEFRDGVAVTGRVLRADGSVAAGVPVTVTYYDPWKDPFDRCDPIIVTRITQKYTDADGAFSVDFIHGSVGFTVAAVDTGGLTVEAIQTILQATVGDRFAAEKLAALAAATNALARLGVESLEEAAQFIEGLDRAVWRDFIPLESGRAGQEMTIGLRFRGRATVAGRVLGPDGVTPVPGAAVNLYPDPDSREQPRGVFSDPNGAFVFRGVPLGVFSVQVKTGAGHFRTVSGNLTRVRETNEVEIVLTAPQPREILRTSLAGRVVEPADQSGHPRARVFLSHTEFGAVASLEADEFGMWTVDDIPAGTYSVRVFSQDNRRKGQGAGEAVAGALAFVAVTLDGVGTVSGRVENSSGVPVANALVAGGETLVRTDGAGRFRLTGVPLGPAVISAGLEAAIAPGGFPRLGSASIQVLPGIENFAVVRLRPVGMIVGRVVDANGEPVPNVKVAIPRPPDGFAWVESDGLGRFAFPNLSPGDYVVSAPSPPVTEDPEEILEGALGRSEEEILAAVQRATSSIRTTVARRYGEAPLLPSGDFGFTRTTLRADGEVVEVNLQYLPTGNVQGTVLNDQGVPIGARVRLTGLGLNALGEPTTVKIGDRDSDPATGEFRIANLPQGGWALQAANPFYPVVLVTNGVTTRESLSLSNVVLQFPPRRETNGRLVGSVVNPDGSPAGAGVRVHINFSDDYEIQTDADGRFDTRIMVPARTYLLEARDPASGLRGSAQAIVLAGLTNSVTVPLLGQGTLRVRVRQADGSPAAGALVRVEQSTFPREQFNGVTGSTGELTFASVFAGRFSVSVKYLTGAATLEARSALDVGPAATATAELVLGPTGTIRGIFRRLAGGSAIPFAPVNVGNLVYPTTDAEGRFEVPGLKPGSYRISAREPVTGRLAAANAVLSRDGEVVEVSLVELPQGTLSGTVYQLGEPGPLPGVEVRLAAEDGLSPVRTVTSGPDGSFRFLGVHPGPFNLQASKSYGPGQNYSQFVRSEFPASGADQTVDLILPRRTVLGRVTVSVAEAGGGPADRATVNGRATDPEGRVVFDGLPLRTLEFFARSTVPGETSSAGRGSVTLSEAVTNASLTISLSGVGRLRGRVTASHGADPVPGAEVRLSARGTLPGVSLETSTLADASGEFAFGNLPLGTFRVTAIDGALAATESGAVTAGGQEVEVQLRLGDSGSVRGRLLRADGSEAVTNAPVLLTFKAPSGLDGAASAVTGSDGTFRFTEIPVGPVVFTANVPAVVGLARESAALTVNGEELDLGNVLLDEDWPEVIEVSPAPGATGVAVDAAVRLVFSEPIATNSIRSDGIYLRSPTNTVMADLSWPTPTNGATRVVVLTPRQPLRSEVTYRVSVVNGVIEDGLGGVLGRGPTDRVERPLLAAFGSSFTTRDADPPTVVSAFPTNGAVQIDPRAVMRFSFNEPIRDTGFAVALAGPSGAVRGSSSLGFGGLVLAFTPEEPLPVNASFTLTLDGVRDLAGNALAGQPRSFTFRTLDTVGPAIAALRLVGGRSPVGGTTVELEAELAEPEHGVSVRFTANGIPAGADDLAPYRTSYRLPDSGTVIFRATATDRFGNDGPLAELPVTVVGNEAPVVTLLRGAPGNAPVPTGTTFAFTVSATDDVAVTNLTVVVSGPTSVVRSFAGGTPTNQVFTVPADALPGGLIEVRARATDSLGAISTEALVTWEVTDGTAPELRLVSPASGTTLDLAQPLPLRLALRDNGTNLNLRVVASGGLNATNEFLVLLPPNAPVTNLYELPLGAAVRSGANLALTVQVADGGGNVGSLSVSYRLPDIEPPRLLSVTPAQGATRVGLWDARRDFEFSEPLAERSVDPAFFATTNEGGLPTAVTLATLGNVVRLNFGSPLQPGITYTNLLRPGIVDRATNALADADGNPLPEGTNLVFTTAAIHSITPTNDTPVLGGDTVRVAADYERELGAYYFRFALNGGTPVEAYRGPGSTNVFADFLVPLDTTNLVVSIQASDVGSFGRALTLPPVQLRFAGNRITNQPPVLLLTRLSPAGGPVALGSIFSVALSATDDFGVTGMTFTASGPVSTNATFSSGARVTFAFEVPTNAPPEIPVHLVATATDTQGATSTVELDIPLLALRYPFAEGTVFYSRGPAAEGTLWAVDPAGTTEVQIGTGSIPVISPDGRYLAFRRGTLADVNRHDLYVRDLATGAEQRVVPESGQGIVGYDWTPDSQRLLFDYGSWIDRIDRDGSNRTRFLGIHSWDDAPAVNRFDGRVAFHNLLNLDRGGLNLADPAGSGSQKIPNTSYGDQFPAWSPDGEWLAFLRDGNVFVIRPDGYDRTQLSFVTGTGAGFRQWPAWNSEGTAILVAGTVNGTNALWSVPTDGSGPTLFRTAPGVNFGYAGRVLGPARVGSPPTFVGADPAQGASGVSLWSTNLVLAFNRALDSNSVTAARVAFPLAGTGLVPAGSRVLLQPPLPLVPGVSYPIALLPGLTDLRGQSVPPTNLSFTTAAILAVSPSNGTPIRGGQFLEASVDFEAGLGARHFRFTLNAQEPVQVPVPAGATRAAARLLVPLDAGDSVLHIAASDDAAFGRPLEFDPIPLPFAGNAGTNDPPQVALTRLEPATAEVRAGTRISLRTGAESAFGITNLLVEVSGAVTHTRSFEHGGPVGVTFEVPFGTAPGSALAVRVRATDGLGVASHAGPLEYTVAAPPALPAVGTIFYSRAPGGDAAAGTIWAVNADGTNDRLITHGVHPRLSPDGRRLLLGRDKSNPLQKNIHVLDLLTGEVDLVVAHTDFVIYYDWLPDLSQVVFDFQCGIEVAEPDGTNRRRVISGSCFDDAPSVNPVDGRVAFQNDRADNGIWITAPDFTGRQLVPNSLPGDYWVQWSPDGQWLAFVRGGNVFKIRPDGSELTRLTTLVVGAYGEGPAVWLPDGSGLAFAATIAGTNGVFTVGADGSGILARIPTGAGDPIRFVGSVARSPVVPSLAPRLVDVDPADGATLQPLWPGETEFVFSQPVDPASVTPARLQLLDSSGNPVPASLSTAGTRVRLRSLAALQPGASYTNVMLPGVANPDGRLVMLANGAPIPPGGARFGFATARVLTLSPTNGTAVVAGQSLPVNVSFHPQLGAQWFRFRIGSGTPVVVPVPAGAGSVSATLAIPVDATSAVLEVEAAEEEAFSRPLTLPPVTLSVTPLGSDLTLVAPSTIHLTRGQRAQATVAASSETAPVGSLGWTDGFVPPSFVSASPSSFTNTAAAGAAGFSLVVDATFALPGTYVLPVSAGTVRGATATTNITIHIDDDPAFAVTRWKDPVNGNWSDASKWTAGVPGPGLPAVIEAPSDVTITLTADATLGHLSLGSGAGTGVATLYLNGRALRVEGQALIGSNGVLRVAGPLRGAGVVTVAGRVQWESGALEAGGQIDLRTNALLRISGAPDKGLYRTLINRGRIEWAAGRLFLASGVNLGAIQNLPGAVFEVQDDLRLSGGSIVNLGALAKVGSVRDPVANFASFHSGFTNLGVLRVESGGVEWLGPSLNHGRYEIATNAALFLGSQTHRTGPASVVTGEGQVAIRSGSVLEVQGDWSMGGLMTVAGTARWQRPAGSTVRTLLLTGELDGEGPLLVTDGFEWRAGNLRGGGVLTLGPAAATEITTAADKGLYRLVRNAGSLRWAGGRLFCQSGTEVGMLHNLTGATLDFATDQPWANGTLLNDGLLVKGGEPRDASRFFTSVSGAFENRGVVRLDAGGLRLTGPTTHRGRLQVADQAAVTLSGTTHVFEPTSDVEGLGAVSFSGGTAEVNGGWSLQGRTTVDATVRIHTPEGITFRDLWFANGTLGGRADLTVEAWVWRAGTLEAGGRFAIPRDAVVTWDGSDKTLTRRLENSGTIQWIAGSIYGAGEFENLAPGVLEMRGAATWYDGRLVNEGWFVRTGNSGATTFWASFFNRGELWLESGTLAVRGLSGHRGSFSIFPGTTLAFHNNLHQAGPGTVIAGGGTLAVDGGADLRLEAGSAVDTAAVLVSGTARFQPGSRIDLQDRRLRLDGTLFLDTGSAIPVRTFELNGILNGVDTVEVLQSLQWTGGQMTGNGTTVVAAEADLLLAGADRSLFRRLVQRGRGLWTQGAFYNNASGLYQIEPGAELEIQGNVAAYSGLLDNRGRIQRTAGTNHTDFAWRVENAGLLEIQSGPFSLSGGGSHAGRISVSAGCRLNLNGVHAFLGSSEISGAGSLAQAGTTDFSGRYDLGGLTTIGGTFEFRAGATPVTSGRTITINGTLRFNAGSAVQLGSLNLAGTLGGADPVTVTSNLSWTSGTMRDAGITTLADGATGTLAEADRNLYRTLILAGDAVWSEGTFYNDANGRLRLEPGATLEMRGNPSFFGGTFENHGAFLRTAGTGTAQVSGVLLNQGMFSLETGTYQLLNAATNSGTLNLGADAVLFIDRGTLALQPGTTFAGNGTLRVGGSARLNLGTDVDFGALQVRFEGFSTVAGHFTMANGPGGWLSIDHSMTLPGSLTIGGEFEVLGAGTTVTVQRNLALLATGSAHNEGILRVGRYEAIDGSTFTGNPPVVIGLPSLATGPAPVIRDLRFGVASKAATALQGPAVPAVELIWDGDPRGAFRIEVSGDLRHWELRHPRIEALGDGRFRAFIADPPAGSVFFRVLDSAAGE